jgi:23S rRNA (uracil1939-C5)-methyltransferase
MESLRAERMAAGGDAIAHHPDGRIVFVDGALPGELVEVTFTLQKKDFAKARVIAVLEASESRQTPPCPAARAGCGGCGWQHIAIDAQRQLKREIVLDALRRTGHLNDADVRLGADLPSDRSRTTVRVAIDHNGRAGFRAARSHDVIVPDSCMVTHRLLDEMIGAARFNETAEAVLRVGARTGDRLAWAIDDGATITGLDDQVATGMSAAVTELVHGHRLRASAPSFFQSSPEAAEAIATAVIEAGGEALASATTVVDAYGGVGLLGVTATPPDARIILIEQSESSTADARVNLAGRQVRIEQMAVERWHPSSVDVVLADPARSGLGRDAISALVASKCSRLVLVSCDPVSAARDANLLQNAGFEFRHAVLLDPFPHTPHMELVSRFDRKEFSSA